MASDPEAAEKVAIDRAVDAAITPYVPRFRDVWASAG
jgi:hypothetical protein